MKKITVFSGGQLRRARRRGDISQMIRADVLKHIASLNDVAACNEIAGDAGRSNRVKRAAARRIAHIVTMSERASIVVDVSTANADVNVSVVAESDDFKNLVEKFRAEGKPNPEKSARASLASKAGAAKRKTASPDAGA